MKNACVRTLTNTYMMKIYLFFRQVADQKQRTGNALFPVLSDPYILGGFTLWRSRWDSNPRAFWANGFQDRLVMTASIQLHVFVAY